MSLRATIATVVALLAVALVSVQGAAESKQQADSFARKMSVIARQGGTTPRAAGQRRTAVSETEVNSWFAYKAQPLLPEGLSRPKVTIVGNGKVMGGATVDLQAIGRQRSSGGTFDPWGYLGGRVPVTVSGRLETANGRGRFHLEGAEVAGLPLPRGLLQEIVSYYSRSAEHPQGVRLDDPFELPANIQRIDVAPGQAVVVQ